MSINTLNTSIHNFFVLNKAFVICFILSNCLVTKNLDTSSHIQAVATLYKVWSCLCYGCSRIRSSVCQTEMMAESTDFGFFFPLVSSE